MNVLTNQLAEQLLPFRSRIILTVGRRFPQFCSSRVEDAVGVAFEVLCRHPERFERALSEGGIRRMVGLAMTIACRHARDQRERQAYQRELGTAIGEPPAPAGWCAVPDPTVALDLHHHLDDLLGEAANGVGPDRAPLLRKILEEKLRTGDQDTELARRFGMRRDQISRAWSQFRREALGITCRKAA